jgi:hypothetical protein
MEMSKIKLFVIIPALLSCLASSAQTVYPYLQVCTSNSIYITWKTSSNVQSLVEYGLSANNLNLSKNGSNQIWTDNGYPNNYYYHSVKLSSLNPNTKYYYKVSSGTFSSTVCSFKTMPLPGQAATADGHIRFLIMGDNQIKAEPRFDSLMVQAKRKCEAKYNGAINDNISLIFNVGDQVDVGTLDHYENVHFAKSKYLSPYIPVQTTVGNHETYGTLQLNAYYNHFFYDSLSYKNIYSGTENWYAYQAGNVLFISLSTEHTTDASQFTWLQKVVAAANTDVTVDWIISLGHRPYQAEQYVGDISTWVRNTAVPFLLTSPKFVIHIGAHHHLYARGQMKDNPAYNVISGGVAWDQYWGMAQEQDFDDVQKTISNWMYNIIDIDVNNQKLNVESYSIGSKYKWKNNMLMDSFHRYKNKPVPQKPTITSSFGDSIQFPFKITTSAFVSPAGELLNSTEFQLSQSSKFSTLEKDIYRDYENLFGQAGATPDSSMDINANLNILNLDMPVGYVPNGKHYVRARHRDRNLEWSAWSAVDSFKVYNSVVGNPALITDKYAYNLVDIVKASYSNGTGLPKDWVGVFKKGDIPGAGVATKWSYTTGVSGTLNFSGFTVAGEYFVAFFTNDSYTEIAPRVPIYIGAVPIVTTSKLHYNVGDSVNVNFTNAPAFASDWLGVYKVGNTPGGPSSTMWSYVSGTSGTHDFTGLPKGYYFVNYFLKDAYTEASPRAFFSVGDTITTLTTNKSIYNLGEYITSTWSDGPGIVKDWLGIYNSGDDPNVQPLLSYTYFGGTPNGTKVLADSLLPDKAGKYFLVMFTNDSYNEVSNRVYFSVIDKTTSLTEETESAHIKIYPNPISKSGNSVIETTYPIDKLEFLDSFGRPVFESENVNSKNFALVNIDLPPGIYYVRIYQDNRKVSTYKLVVCD